MDQRDGLLARWEYYDDTDGGGSLNVSARSQGFAGLSSAFFTDADLTAFAAQLAAAFPLGERRFSISGGYDDPLEEHVGITVRALGRRGQLGIAVHLATPSSHSSDYQWASSDARLVVLTSYEALGRFASELQHLMVDKGGEAWLAAEEL